MTDEDEHECYQEAIRSEQKTEWIAIMKDEMQSLLDNHTYVLVKLPKERKALKNRWFFRIKHGGRFKASLVVKGFC